MPATHDHIPRRRWYRVRAPLLFVMALVAVGSWCAWRHFDVRTAMDEAVILGWSCEFNDPVDRIKKDWKAAFQMRTWNEAKCDVDVRKSEQLIEHAKLLRRISPHRLHVGDISALKDMRAFVGLSDL